MRVQREGFGIGAWIFFRGVYVQEFKEETSLNGILYEYSSM